MRLASSDVSAPPDAVACARRGTTAGNACSVVLLLLRVPCQTSRHQFLRLRGKCRRPKSRIAAWLADRRRVDRWQVLQASQLTLDGLLGRLEAQANILVVPGATLAGRLAQGLLEAAVRRQLLLVRALRLRTRARADQASPGRSMKACSRILTTS